MSKEEFLKIQTCVLKVNIHCDGCKHKVKKILQKIEGVYTVKIDSEQGKATVSGNVDPSTLMKKLIKSGKHAEIWGAQKSNNNNSHNNQNQLNNQLKNLQMDSGKGGNNKGQQSQKGGGGGGGGGGNNNQKKGGPPGQNPQLQQLQQMKAFQDSKMGQLMKGMKMPSNSKDQNAKTVKFKLPEDDGMSDDDFDDDFDDGDEFDDDEEDLDDDMDDGPLHKMKPVMGNGHGGMHNIMNGQNPHQLMKGAGGGGGGGNGGGGNGKKGSGGGNIPVQMNHGGGGKKAGNGGNQSQGGGKGGKSAGGGGGNGGNFMANGAKSVGGMNDGPHGMPNMMAMKGGGLGQMGNMLMGPMGSLPMGQMGNYAAVQGLPASAHMGGGGGGGGGGYFQGGGPDHMQGNPYQQQQLAAMMMNQQRANGNERFHPMMYARPPPAVNYVPSFPQYTYPPHGDRAEQYTMFSDENTSSCTVM